MIDIGGFRLHLQNMGCGSPAVIIDSGLGGISSDWEFVQKEIAKFTRVVCYDRAGIAWSESSPFPRTSKQIVKELHMLLQKANIQKPYILVGHSFGGVNVQLYAITYPDEVEALVLVDSASEEQLTKLPMHPLYEIFKSMHDPEDDLFQSKFGFGSFVTKTYIQAKLPTAPKHVRDIYTTFFSIMRHNVTNGLEANTFAESLHQLALSDRSLIKNKPCILITAELFEDLAPFKLSKEQQNEIHAKQVNWQKSWKELQRGLAAKFTQSHQIVAQKSDHSIPWNQPEIIVRAVKELIDIFPEQKFQICQPLLQ
jgi:pimeloyl-ACP methyl ester carboxylesterase